MNKRKALQDMGPSVQMYMFMWMRGGPAWQLFTHMMGRKPSLALCFALSSCCCSAAATRLLVVELQILQALRQGQFLLDSHAQQRVQGLLLVLCSSQLPLHVVQLGHVLVTPETKWGEAKAKHYRGTLLPAGGAVFAWSSPAVSHFILFPDFSRWEAVFAWLTQLLHQTFPNMLCDFSNTKMHSEQTQLFQLFMLSTVPVPVQQMSRWEHTSNYA